MNRILLVANDVVLKMMMELLFGLQEERGAGLRQHAFFFDGETGGAGTEDPQGRIEATWIGGSFKRTIPPPLPSKAHLDSAALTRLLATLRSIPDGDPRELSAWDARVVPQKPKPGRFKI